MADLPIFLSGRAPASTEEGLRNLWQFSGIPDVQGGLSALGRGEVLEGLGQGTAGVAQLLPGLKPAAIGLAGVFAGRKALGASTRDLMFAKGLDAMKNWKTPTPEGAKEVFDMTGWFKGVDGQWRHIISDERAKLNLENLNAITPVGETDPRYIYQSIPRKREMIGDVPQEPFRLPDILDHSDLYEAYPHLREVEVNPLGLFDIIGGAKGGTAIGGKQIFMGPQNKEGFLSTLMHEIQHSIQEYEGFARGGNNLEFLPEGHSEAAAVARGNWKEEIEKPLRELEINPYTLRDYINMDNKGKLDDWSRQYYGEKLKDVSPELMQKARTLYEPLVKVEQTERQAFDDYLALAGEVEARTVQEQLARRDWSQMPSQMEGYVPAGQQIVKFPKGPMPRLEEVDHNPFQDTLK